MTDTQEGVIPVRARPLLGRLLERALNLVVAFDPTASGRLQSLQGRALRFEMTAPRVAFAATVDQGRFHIGPVAPDEGGDLSLQTTLSALASRALKGLAPGAEAGPGGRMHISGDAELAHSLQDWMKAWTPDVEAAFAGVFGDVFGVALARTLKNALASMRSSGASLARDTRDFLTEESRDLVGRAELEAFHEDVDEISDRVDMLARRFERSTGNPAT